MNKYKNKRYGQILFDGTVVDWRKKKRLEKKRKKFIERYKVYKESEDKE